MILETLTAFGVPTALLLPLILGPLSSVLMDLVKKSSRWVALQNARVKQLIVVGLAAVTYYSTFFIDRVQDAQSDATSLVSVLMVALTAGMAFATKNLREAASKP